MRLEPIRAALLFPIRASAFAIGFTAYWMEIAADFLVGSSSLSEYIRTGSCRRCGRCCRLLALEMPGFMVRRPWLTRIAMLWHDLAFNFEPAGVEGNYLLYSCRYYREGCSIYPFRHRICRFFPRQRLYGRIPLADDCGFKFVKREVARRIKDRRREGERVFGDVMGERAARTPDKAGAEEGGGRAPL